MIKINDIEITEPEITDRSTIPKLQVVYFLVSPSNKAYVGSAEEAYNRLNIQYLHYENTSNNRPIENAIRKYGWANFKIYLIHVFETPVSSDEMLALETAYIAFFDTTNPKIGYNVLLMGFSRMGTKHSEETKTKMSLVKIGKFSGEKNPMWGKHLSEEEKKNISDSLKGKYCGENNWNYRKILSEEHKQKLRENHYDNSGKNNPMYGRLGKDNVNSKLIKQIDKNTSDVIKIWDSVADASKFLKMHHS